MEITIKYGQPFLSQCQLGYQIHGSLVVTGEIEC